MKTLANSFFAALTVTVFSFTAAQAEPQKPVDRPQKAAAFQTGMFTTAEGKLQIAVDKQYGGSVVVQLKNSAGADLFVQKIGKNQPGARMRLNVSELPDGIYQIVVSNGAETTTQTVTLSTKKASEAPRFISVR